VEKSIAKLDEAMAGLSPLWIRHGLVKTTMMATISTALQTAHLYNAAATLLIYTYALSPAYS